MRLAESLDNSIQINEAFSKQSVGYDEEDLRNPLLQAMRSQVYSHIARFINKPSRILELNAGTGIDALHFVQQGHAVHATDLSDGMIQQIKRKIELDHRQGLLTVQQLSYDQLYTLKGQKFDFVFSNFGGLNCIDDLSKVTKNFRDIMNPGGYVTLVIMPQVCVWEIVSFFKGNRNAFRRFNKKGVIAHLEDRHFRVWYYSLRSIKRALGSDFKLVGHEGLAALLPPPHASDFPGKYPGLYKALKRVDAVVRNYVPFNRWADHIIVSFQFVS